VSCDNDSPTPGYTSLRLTASEPSIVEAYSRLIPVQPNQTYRVSYWVKTDLYLDPSELPDLYGKVIAAQYSSAAQEGDPINANRLDPGFDLGESVGGQTDWAYRVYTFRTLDTAAYVRLRGVIGGTVGTAWGSMWLDQVSLDPE
jgi:hypothetical protein